MSKTFNQTKYNSLLEDFNKACKRVEVSRSEGRQLSTDPGKLTSYKQSIVSAYNKLVKYSGERFTQLNEESKTALRSRIKSSRERTNKVFQLLNLTYDWSDQTFHEVDIGKCLLLNSDTNGATASSSSVTDTNFNDNSDSNTAQTDIEDKNIDSQSEVASNTDVLTTVNSQTKFDDSNLTDDFFESPNDTDEDMPQTAADFYKVAGTIINYKYDGDPLKLESFIADVELLDSMAEEQNKDVCVKYVRSRCELNALEVLPKDVKSVNEIIIALRGEIKPRTVDEIEDKIDSLRLIKGNYSIFQEKAEKLAEDFRRALVFEGSSIVDARKKTIRKMRQLCRNTARDSVVKSVVESTQFETPNQVISFFVVQSGIANKERKSSQNAQNKPFSGNFNRNQNNNRQRNGNQRNNNNGGRFIRQQNNSQNGNRQNNNRQNNTNDNRQNGNRRQNRNEHTIRLVQGNAQDPPTGGSQSESTVVHIPM